MDNSRQRFPTKRGRVHAATLSEIGMHIPPPPPLLYKYLPPERIDVLEKQIISFTRPTWFNDPFELNPLESYGYEFTGEAKSAIKTRINRKLKNDFEEVWRRYLQGQHVAVVERSVGILCLSANPRSLLMWAHYAASHTGFILEFMQNGDFYDSLGAPIKVDYVCERPVLDMDDDDLYAKTFYTKSTDWSYEEEFRIIKHCSDLEKYTPTAGLEILIGRIDPKTISRVILGCRISQANRGRICRVLESCTWGHVKIKEAKLHTRNFAVKYHDLRRECQS